MAGSPAAIAGGPGREFVIEVDNRAKRQRRRPVHERDLPPVTVGGAPLRLRKAARVRPGDSWKGESVPTTRQLVEQCAAQRPANAIDRASTAARDVVQRPVHRGGNTLGDDFLDVKFADVRRGTLAEPGPVAVPLDRLIAQLVERGKPEPFDSAVCHIATEPLKSRRRIRTNARLRDERLAGERRGSERGGKHDSKSKHFALVEVDRQKGK